MHDTDLIVRDSISFSSQAAQAIRKCQPVAK